MLTDAERAELADMRDHLKVLRFQANQIELATHTIWNRLMDLDDLLLDRIHKANRETP